MYELNIFLSNVHCSECEETIYRLLSKFFHLTRLRSSTEIEDDKEEEDINKNTVIFNLSDNVLRLVSNSADKLSPEVASKVVKSIRKAGFVINSWNEYDKTEGESLQNEQPVIIDHNADDDINFNLPWPLSLFSEYKSWRSKKNHLKSCKLCREEKNLPKTDSEGSDSIETLVDHPDKAFRAVFSVGGMTCASCSNSVSTQIDNVLKSYGDSDKGMKPEFFVNLLQNSAVVIVPNKQMVNKIISEINDSGFECRLLELLPIQESLNVKVTALIGGVSCASCVNTIQTSVDQLPFVLSSGVNAVTKVGQFVLENSKSDTNINALKRVIEDCGFDFELISKDSINYSTKISRSIHLRVDGMFCNNCLAIIMQYLDSHGEAVIIEDQITLSDPFIKFKYIPSKTLNIRKLLYDLNHLVAYEDSFKITDNEGTFSVTLVEQASMDEHLRNISKKEFQKILSRLILAVVAAIPTFIFGVVGMSLLSSTNDFRIWLDEPLWAGSVSRNTWVLFFLSTPVYFLAADIFHRKAIKEIISLWAHRNSFRRRFLQFGSMNLLMSIGTSISYFASIWLLGLSAATEGKSHGLSTTYFDSVVFLTFFLLIGRLLESLTKRKAADALSGLDTLKVNKATLVEENDDGTFGNDETMDVKLLESGDFIRITSGDSPAVDCIVMEGSSEFDESALTGESVPVKHDPGHQIFSGTVNVGNTSVVAKILDVENGSLIDKIVETVRNGQMRKAPIEKTADKLTGSFVPVIILVSIMTLLIWLILAYSNALPKSYLDIDVGGWTVWSLEFAIAVFVIACPCGIGLAAPTALLVGSGLAAKYGILAKGGGVAFQQGSKIKSICFDKTGTLTTGDFKITDFGFTDEIVEKEKLTLMALQVSRDLELASKHPIATAVKSFVTYQSSKMKRNLSHNIIPEVEVIPGKGLTGVIVDEEVDISNSSVDNSRALLGNEALMIEKGVKISKEQGEILRKWKSERKSVILVSIISKKLFKDDSFHLVLIMACRDQVRSETKRVISHLQDVLKLQCWMITGDNRLTAESLAREISIDNVVSEVLPEDKEQQVKRIRRQTGGVVAMIGDGINDAPALATADVGIALSSGTDIAITSSDFILLNRTFPLLTLPILLELSKACFNRVKFNFCWSLIYNIVGVPIAAGVIYPYHNSRLNPVWASAAMAASSISVVASSLALRLFRPKIREEDFKKSFNTNVEEAQEVILRT